MTHPASGAGPAVPAELAALLAAGREAEREQAWAGFVRAYTPTMLRVARSLGGDADLPMDRYAFVLEHLREDDCRRLRAYSRPTAGDFTLWLVVVVRRLCLDHHRKRYGRSRGFAGPQEKSERGSRRRLVDLVADQTDPSLLAGSPGTAPDEQLIQAERMDVLAATLSRLPAADRLLLRLRFAEDLSAREITGIMRFPTIFHVYRRLDAVLRDLRVTLGSRGIEPGP